MKFAERLAAHITPEWQTQYIKYDEMKDFLYHYEENAPVQDGRLSFMLLFGYHVKKLNILII